MNDNHVLTSAKEIIVEADLTKTRAWTTVTEQQMTAIIRGGTAVTVSQTARGFDLSYGNVRRQFFIESHERAQWIQSNSASVSLFTDIEVDQPGIKTTWALVEEKDNFVNNVLNAWSGYLKVGLWDDGFSLSYGEGKVVSKFKLVGVSPLSWLLANLHRHFTLVPPPPESAAMHAIPLIKEKPMNEKPGNLRGRIDPSEASIFRHPVAGGYCAPPEPAANAATPTAQQGQSSKAESAKKADEHVSVLPQDADMLTCNIRVAEDCFWVISKDHPKSENARVEPAKLVTSKDADGREMIVLRESGSTLLIPDTQLEAALTAYSVQATHASYAELVCGFCSWVGKHLTGGHSAEVRVYLEEPFACIASAVHYESVILISALINGVEKLSDLGMHRLASLTLAMRNLSDMSVGESAEFDLISLPMLFRYVRKTEEDIQSAATFQVAGKMFQCTGVDADGVYVKVVKVN